MKATEGSIGRAFVLRLEDEDVIPDCIESFAREHGVNVAQVLFLGGLGRGEVVTGPRDSTVMPPDPILIPVEGAHETIGVGLVAPDEGGIPRLHVHGALGRAGRTTTGCLRNGVSTWFMIEAIVVEIVANACRRRDERSGLSLLDFEGDS